jgi:rubrerythrin
MTLLARVRGLVRDDTIYECRQCGTTLEADLEECPVCGSGEIVSYDLN